MYHKFHNSILISIRLADLFVAYDECKQTHAQPTANVRMSLTWRHRSGIFQKTCTSRSYNSGNVRLWICNTRHLRTLSDDDIEVVGLQGPRTRNNGEQTYSDGLFRSKMTTESESSKEIKLNRGTMEVCLLRQALSFKARARFRAPSRV